MSFLDIVSKFNQQANSHSKSQALNPFSEQFDQSRSPSPRFSREEYGKPVAGSKTDLRGRKAKSHICREILELCTVIHDVGTYNAKKRDPDDDDNEENDGTIIVSFGELFQIYTKISDKVVGLLIAAKRRGFVYFDREILFQRRDDDVLIALMKPISEISKTLKDDINQANAPAATAVEPKPVEKKKSTNKTKRVKPASDGEQATTQFETAVKPTNGLIEINNKEFEEINVKVENDHNKDDCNEENNEIISKELVDNVIEISENTEVDSNQRNQEDISVQVNGVIENETETKQLDNINSTVENHYENQSIVNGVIEEKEVDSVRNETYIEIHKIDENDDSIGNLIEKKYIEDVSNEGENISNETKHICLNEN